MADINDLKLDALNTLGYTTGTVNDREKAWLEALTSSTGDLDDLWMQYMEDLGYTTGTLNDRQMQAWGALTYTGTWNDRAKQFWAAGGTFASSFFLLESGDQLLLVSSGSLLLEQ